MTSKIKVDNIENQCGGAVVTKCGGTTTISGTVVKSNAIQASDGGNLVSQSGTTITLGATGDTINLASGASQSGFGRTGTVDWITTPKTATFTAVSGEGYFCNTSGGAFTVNLPAGSAGAIVSLADYAGTWQTNAITVTPNGTDKIGSVANDATLNVEGQSVTFVYVDSTQGWINTMDSTSNVRGIVPFLVVSCSGGAVTTSGNCKIHTFTGPGSFTVCATSTTVASRNKLAYLVTAGGGGGGYSNGGGGGAGGFREGKCNTVTPYTASPLVTTAITATAQTYPVTVGGGSAGGNPISVPTNIGISGSNSIFSTITSTGGGGGGAGGGNGLIGGSGGGGGNGTSGGAGNTPPVSPAQGFSGGSGPGSGGPAYGAAGGGGATASGANGTTSSGGNGGGGATTSITASSVEYSGGGGGANDPPSPSPSGGAPSAGGGGNGSPTGNGGNATANSGSGGGGTTSHGGGTIGGSGGSGIVVIRYKFQ